MKRAAVDKFYHNKFFTKKRLQQMIDCARTDKERFVELADPLIRKAYAKSFHRSRCATQKLRKAKFWKYEIETTPDSLVVVCTCGAIILSYDAKYDPSVLRYSHEKLSYVCEFEQIEWRNKCYISKLTNNALAYCFKFLTNVEDLYACRRVNKIFSKAASHSSLWRPFVDALGPVKSNFVQVSDKLPLYSLYAIRTVRIEPSWRRHKLLKCDYKRFAKYMCKFVEKHFAEAYFMSEMVFFVNNWFANNLGLSTSAVNIKFRDGKFSLWCNQCEIEPLITISAKKFLVRSGFSTCALSVPLSFFNRDHFNACKHGLTYTNTRRNKPSGYM